MTGKPDVTVLHGLRVGDCVAHAQAGPDGITFSVCVPEGETATLLLYEKGGAEPVCEIALPEGSGAGEIRAVRVSGLDPLTTEYNYRIGGRIVTDPAAQAVRGLTVYGDRSLRGEHQIRAGFAKEDFDWDGDKAPRIPFSESVLYQLHVRGFTKAAGSKVKKRGTFAGLTEKIPYMKDLGITGIVLLPAYEFDEITAQEGREGWRPQGLKEMVEGAALPAGARDPEKAVLPHGYRRAEKKTREGRLNYWGFGPGWYFAPKRSYCAGDVPEDEFRSMVRAFHQAGIEVLMEFSFPAADPAFMQAALAWWVQFYHVDGFFLLADQADCNAVARSPLLRGVKLVSDYFPTDRIYPGGRRGTYRHLAECNHGYRQDVRCMLKGDADRLEAFVGRTRYNPKDAAVINTITGHDGFTLMDLVSYNDKHNEDNGEQNHDGAPTEYSWNCGVEGPTRRRDVTTLRMRQIRNALAMLLLSQGTPMLLAGDEFGNSQSGNNNPYCHDGPLTWLNWPSTRQAEQIRAFAKEMIALRARLPLLHREAALTGNNAGGFYPDFSCHGREAWFASFDEQDRHVGLMYCGGEPESYLYCAYNFHWDARTLALPYLPDGWTWQCVLDTAQPGAPDRAQAGRTEAEAAAVTEESGPDAATDGKADGKADEKAATPRELVLPGRSIRVLVGVPGPAKQEAAGRKTAGHGRKRKSSREK